LNTSKKYFHGYDTVQDYSIADKEICYGKDYEKKEEKQSHKSKEACYLYLLKLRESHKNPFSSLFSQKGRRCIYLPTLRHIHQRSPARLRTDGGRDLSA
jgi:hypothetical protein